MSLKLWRDTRDIKRPLIVLVSGFMTENSIDSHPSQWSQPLLRFSIENDYALGYFLWEAQSVFNHKVNSLKPDKLTLGVLSTWKDATKKAEQAAMELRKTIKASERPIILVGHSLGGRIILRACERVPKDSVRALIALAPAYEKNKCKFENIARAVSTKPIIYFSQKDSVLAHLFSLGQNQNGMKKGIQALKSKDKIAIVKAFSHILVDYGSSMAIGQYGVPKQYEHLFSQHNVSPLGHNDYYTKVYELLDNRKAEL